MLIREGDNVADLLPVEDAPRQAVRPEVVVCFDPFRPVVCRHEENAARAKDASDFPDKHGEVNAVLDCRDRDSDIELAGSAPGTCDVRSSQPKRWRECPLLPHRPHLAESIVPGYRQVDADYA